MSKTRSKIDIGLIWAKYMNIWGQVGSIAGTVNMIMMLGVFYTTTLQPNVDIPLWLYILIVVVGASCVILFVLRVGISGYYRFFSKQSEVSDINKRVQENSRRLGLILEKLGIEDKDGENAN